MTTPELQAFSTKDLVNLPPEDNLFRINDGWLTIEWGGYEYDIEMSDISTPLALLDLIAHVAAKEWEQTTGVRIAELIEAVCREKGWDLYGAGG